MGCVSCTVGKGFDLCVKGPASFEKVLSNLLKADGFSILGRPSSLSSQGDVDFGFAPERKSADFAPESEKKSDGFASESEKKGADDTTKSQKRMTDSPNEWGEERVGNSNEGKPTAQCRQLVKYIYIYFHQVSLVLRPNVLICQEYVPYNINRKLNKRGAVI